MKPGLQTRAFPLDLSAAQMFLDIGTIEEFAGFAETLAPIVPKLDFAEGRPSIGRPTLNDEVAVEMGFGHVPDQIGRRGSSLSLQCQRVTGTHFALQKEAAV